MDLEPIPGSITLAKNIAWMGHSLSYACSILITNIALKSSTQRLILTGFGKYVEKATYSNKKNARQTLDMSENSHRKIQPNSQPNPTKGNTAETSSKYIVALIFSR